MLSYLPIIEEEQCYRHAPAPARWACCLLCIISSCQQCMRVIFFLAFFLFLLSGKARSSLIEESVAGGQRRRHNILVSAGTYQNLEPTHYRYNDAGKMDAI